MPRWACCCRWLIALIVTPWLSLKLLRRHGDVGDVAHAPEAHRPQSRPSHVPKVMTAVPVRRTRRSQARLAVRADGRAGAAGGRRWRCSVLVVLKMLPFDNKSEFQVVVDMPEGTPLEQTAACCASWAPVVARCPKCDYRPMPAPPRRSTSTAWCASTTCARRPNVGDLQVNLVDKHHRERRATTSPRALRDALPPSASAHGASVKVVEVPPGPPVLSPIVAEVYGPDYRRPARTWPRRCGRFERTEGIVDIDDSGRSPTRAKTWWWSTAQGGALGVPRPSSPTLRAGLGRRRRHLPARRRSIRCGDARLPAEHQATSMRCSR
jgi:multidrug efflux pump subunit AcrB